MNETMTDSMVAKVVDQVKDDDRMEGFVFKVGDEGPYGIIAQIEKPYTDTKGVNHTYTARLTEQKDHYNKVKSITVYHDEACYSRYSHSHKSNIKRPEKVIELLTEGYVRFVQHITSRIASEERSINVKNTIATELPNAKKIAFTDEWALIDAANGLFSGVHIKKVDNGYTISNVLGKLSADQVKAIFEIVKGAGKTYSYMSYEKENVDKA